MQSYNTSLVFINDINITNISHLILFSRRLGVGDGGTFREEVFQRVPGRLLQV